MYNWKGSLLKQILSLKHICDCCGSPHSCAFVHMTPNIHTLNLVFGKDAPQDDFTNAVTWLDKTVGLWCPPSKLSHLWSVTRSCPQVIDELTLRHRVAPHKKIPRVLLKVLQTPHLSNLCLKKLGSWCLGVIVIIHLADQCCFPCLTLYYLGLGIPLLFLSELVQLSSNLVAKLIHIHNLEQDVIFNW